MTAGPPGSVAILAGSGELPSLLADSLARRGIAVRILAFRGFAGRSLRRRADAVVDLLDVQRIVGCLDGWAPAAVTLAGGLRRPSPAALVGAYSALRNREEVAEIVGRGDDNLLRAAIDLLERRGLRCVGIRDLAPELLAPAGLHTRARPDWAAERAIEIGFDLLSTLSRFDIGQAAVIAGERVLSLEGPEGTDRMLSRLRPLSPLARFRGRTGPRAGVLVKTPKIAQDQRVDLPAIGPKTVANAARAGLAGIAISSGETLILQYEATIAAADRLGLFILARENPVG